MLSFRSFKYRSTKHPMAITVFFLLIIVASSIVSTQPDSASTEGEDSDDESKSWSREKIELTDELLARCREVYDEAINSGKGKTAALKEAAGKVLGDEGKYKTVERRLSL